MVRAIEKQVEGAIALTIFIAFLLFYLGIYNVSVLNPLEKQYSKSAYEGELIKFFSKNHADTYVATLNISIPCSFVKVCKDLKSSDPELYNKFCRKIEWYYPLHFTGINLPGVINGTNDTYYNSSYGLFFHFDIPTDLECEVPDILNYTFKIPDNFPKQPLFLSTPDILYKLRYEGKVIESIKIDGNDVDFCYMHSNGECNNFTSGSLVTGVVVNISSYRDSSSHTLSIMFDSFQNGAKFGQDVFLFYEDFSTIRVSDIYDRWQTSDDVNFSEQNNKYLINVTGDGYIHTISEVGIIDGGDNSKLLVIINLDKVINISYIEFKCNYYNIKIYNSDNKETNSSIIILDYSSCNEIRFDFTKLSDASQAYVIFDSIIVLPLYDGLSNFDFSSEETQIEFKEKVIFSRDIRFASSDVNIDEDLLYTYLYNKLSRINITSLNMCFLSNLCWDNLLGEDNVLRQSIEDITFEDNTSTSNVYAIAKFTNSIYPDSKSIYITLGPSKKDYDYSLVIPIIRNLSEDFVLKLSNQFRVSGYTSGVLQKDGLVFYGINFANKTVLLEDNAKTSFLRILLHPFSNTIFVFSSENEYNISSVYTDSMIEYFEFPSSSYPIIKFYINMSNSNKQPITLSKVIVDRMDYNIEDNNLSKILEYLTFFNYAFIHVELLNVRKYNSYIFIYDPTINKLKNPAPTSSLCYKITLLDEKTVDTCDNSDVKFYKELPVWVFYYNGTSNYFYKTKMKFYLKQ